MKKIVPIIVLVLIVVSASTALAGNKWYSQFFFQQQENNGFNQVSADLRLNLTKLMIEHAVMASLDLQNLYDGKDTSPTQNILDNNTNALSAIIAQVYGNDIGSQFNSLWTQHLQDYEQYTVSLKNNDEAGMQQAQENLSNVSQQLGQLLASNNNAVNAGDITNMMNEHVSITLNMIQAYSQQDLAGVVNLMKQGTDQAQAFADNLASVLSQNIDHTQPSNSFNY